MKIKLLDLPEEGKTYKFTRATAELNVALSDLIKDQDYLTEFYIKPLNTKNFEVRGSIKVSIPSLCSKCGDDFKFGLTKNFHEILTPELPIDRTGKYSRTKLPPDEETAISNYEYGLDMIFDTAEYFHEIVGISAPLYPHPPVDKDENCTLCFRYVAAGAFDYADEEPIQQEKGPSPFDVLANLKSN